MPSSDASKLERTAVGRRFRNANGSCSIATLKRNIEEIFGLPRGCVVIRRNGRAHMWDDEKVGDLRNEWNFDIDDE